ncbi:hypothetical protein [Candidatus Nesciobacter abundans]|uniref:hypothetical protein n=1 Tax=Candidatus Nesciobacter abundans TaxID=2601668 RepID=UPI0016534840|nr:hypothetical protein [Candidatus Nesciobacter abundans]
MFKIIGNGAFGSAMASAIKRSGFEYVVIDSFSGNVCLNSIEDKKQDNTYNNLNRNKKTDLELNSDNSNKDSYKDFNDYPFLIPAVPSYAVPNIVEKYSSKKDHIIFISKGVLENGLILGEWADKKGIDWSVIAGPHFANEIMKNLPTTSILGSEELIPEVMSFSNMGFMHSKMKKGIQFCGAMKNIIAYGCGVVSGLGLGKNAVASFLNKGFLDLRKLLMEISEEEVIFSPAGIGDLCLTASSDSSRNFKQGFERSASLDLNNVKSYTKTNRDIDSSSNVNASKNINGQILSEAKHSALAMYNRFGDNFVTMKFVSDVLNESLSTQEQIKVQLFENKIFS